MSSPTPSSSSSDTCSVTSRNDVRTHKTIYIRNIDDRITSAQLYELFKPIGDILSCKVATTRTGESKEYGFVTFKTGTAAETAISTMNNTLHKGKKMSVMPFLSSDERRRHKDEIFTNLYVKHIADNIDDDQLYEMFERFGEISSAKIERNKEGKSEGFAFVNFVKHESALEAIDEMHEEEIDGLSKDGKTLYVQPKQNKRERAETVRQFKQQHTNVHEGTNLYVKNLDADVDDNQLRQAFERFGEITSAKVMRDGVRSKEFGFVSFSTGQEASEAIRAMHGLMPSSLSVNRELYVSFSQKKSDRKEQLKTSYEARKRSQFNEPLQHNGQYHHNMIPPPSVQASMMNRYPPINQQMGPFQQANVPHHMLPSHLQGPKLRNQHRRQEVPTHPGFGRNADENTSHGSGVNNSEGRRGLSYIASQCANDMEDRRARKEMSKNTDGGARSGRDQPEYFHRRRDYPNSRRDDTHNRRDDSHHRRDYSHHRRDDTHSRHNDTHNRRDDSRSKRDDSQNRRDDPHSRRRDTSDRQYLVESSRNRYEDSPVRLGYDEDSPVRHGYDKDSPVRRGYDYFPSSTGIEEYGSYRNDCEDASRRNRYEDSPMRPLFDDSSMRPHLDDSPMRNGNEEASFGNDLEDFSSMHVNVHSLGRHEDFDNEDTDFNNFSGRNFNDARRRSDFEEDHRSRSDSSSRNRYEDFSGRGRNEDYSSRRRNEGSRNTSQVRNSGSAQGADNSSRGSRSEGSRNRHRNQKKKPKQNKNAMPSQLRK